MIVGTKYASSKVDTKYDAIVIGSGLSGLTTAAMLGKAGRKVLVLEQHYTAGGFTHAWTRKGYAWDVGVHYVGEMTNPNSMMRQLFDFITDGNLDWAPMDPVYDRIVMPDQIYDFVKGEENFRAQMVEYFPDSRREIDQYLKLIRKGRAAAWAHFGPRQLPGFAQPAVSAALRRTAASFWRQSTQDVLESFIDDQRLIGVLTGQWGDWGTPPRRTAFGMHAAVANHFMEEGGGFPMGGASRIAQTVVPVIERCGGHVFTQAEVDQILVRDNRAYGVRMANGDEILADQVVSATGLTNTWSRLIPADAGERTRIPEKVARLEPGIGHIALYLGVKGDREELELDRTNFWVYRGYDHDAELARFTREPSTDFAMSYISFLSAKDPEWPEKRPGKSTVDVITPIPYDWFRKWERLPQGDRGEDYLEYKEQLSNALLEDVYKFAPKVHGKIEVQELSTPLSTEHFSQYFQGPMYGLDHTVERFNQTWIKPKTPIKGLYISGQDMICAGVASTLVAGAITSVNMLGPSAARLLPELGQSRGLPTKWLGKAPGFAVRAPKAGVKLAEPEPIPRTFTARCVEVLDVTADTKALRFVDVAGDSLHYQPGQFVTFHIDVDGTTHQRSYSMSSDPTPDGIFEVTVKRIEGGLISNWLCDSVAVGDELTVSGSHGHFTCGPTPRRKVLMLSAGSGITPMLSMSRWATRHQRDVDIVFFHNARTREDTIFGAELEQLAKDNPRLELHVSMTREGKKDGWDGLTGYLDRTMLEEIVPDFAECNVYSCGPEGFMESARSLFDDAGFRMSRYFEETYTAPDAVVTSGGTLTFEKSGKSIPCASLQTILEAAEASGISISNACRTGDCGECTLQTLSGEAPMSSTAGLDPADEEDGLVLTCVAYAEGDVVLDA